MDEPFSGFDPVNAQLIKEEILRLKKEGTTVLLSSHRMENVEEICDHVAMLNESKKVLDGTITELKNKFKGDQYKVICQSPISNTGQYIIQSESKTDEWFEYYLKLNGTSNEALLELINHTEVTHFEEIVPSLEEIFFNQVKGENHA